MSLTAQQLIESALRTIGAYASGESPTANELSDGLQALQVMLESWSAENIRLWYTYQESFVLSGAASYTIGSGGTFSTVRPQEIRGSYVRDSDGVDHILRIMDEREYRELRLKTLTGTAEYLWYSPEYPLGKIYLWPQGGSTLYLDSLKPLTNPSAVGETISFPPEYNEAIKWGLAVRLCPEYGKEPTPFQAAMAKDSLSKIENKNFSAQINSVYPEIIALAHARYNIDEG